MKVEDELVAFLNQYFDKSRNKFRLENKKRDIEIISYYYGFRESKWPTQEETAKRFNVGKTNTRERIRQLVDEFRSIAPLSNLPALVECSKVLCQHNGTSIIDFTELLIKSNFIDDGSSIRGLLNYMQDFGLCCDYDIFSPYLERITRGKMDLYIDMFLFTNDKAKETLYDYKKARVLPGLLGITNFSHVCKELPHLSHQQKELLKKIIKAQNAWVLEVGDEFWYTYEDRKNTLINYSKKLFSVIDRCDSKTLTSVYRNALDRRTNKFPYPQKEIIEKYLETSKFFISENGELIFIGEKIPLVSIENDVISYLQNKNPATYSELKLFLESKGHAKSNIDKAIDKSPLVLVDKKEGRGHYKYCMVSSLRIEKNKNLENNRYTQFKNKLKNILLSGTNEPIETTKRREQTLLRSWVFNGAEKLNCAICGRLFDTLALVAAHKKPRNKCSEIERVDPYIVMPICVFGCDFLYENNFIQVDQNGIIRANLDKKNDTTEFSQATQLDGKLIPKQWFQGPWSYFDKSI